jgi:hypothetical protein
MRADADVPTNRSAVVSAGVKKPCVLCGRTCVGYPRYKKSGEDRYRHRRCPTTPAGDDTAGPQSGSERSARGGETTDDGYLTPVGDGVGSAGWFGATERLRRRKTSKRSPAEEAVVARRIGSGADDVSSIARAVDDAYKAFKAIDVNTPWVRRTALASTVVYVAGAWLYVLPSSLRMAANAVIFALQIGTICLILAGTFVFVGLVSRDDSVRVRRGVTERFSTLRYYADELTRRTLSGDTADVNDVPHTPKRTPVSNRFACASEPIEESPRTTPVPMPTPSVSTPSPYRVSDAERDVVVERLTEEKQRLAAEKRDADALLDEASETIAFLRDALQAVDDARASDRRRLVELERKLSRETHNVKALSRRVKSKETAMAAAEPWMLDT